MKNLSSLTLSTTFMLAISCSSHHTNRSETPRVPTVNSSEVEEELADFPRASFNFALPELKCENILKFVESYQLSHLPQANVKTGFDCIYSKDNLQIQKSVEFYASESLAKVIFVLDSSQMKDLDKKPLGKVITKASQGLDTKTLDHLSEMFAKWVDKNSLTLGEACERAHMKAEECSLPGEM